MHTLRFRGVVLAAAAALVLTAAAGAAVLLVDFAGYDYWHPGGCYNAIGHVPSANTTYLNFDYSANEYTFCLRDVCVVQQDNVGPYVIYTMSGGAFDVYGDPRAAGTPADYGINPPNATAPSTWNDGECVVGGDFTDFMIVFDPTSGEGNLQGTLTLNRGTQLDHIPPDQRTGWTLAGLRATPSGIPVPGGYFTQVDGHLYIDDRVPTESGTWGGLKQRFKGGR